jgi:hypothetical protein
MNFGKLLKRTVELTAALAAGAYVYNKAKEYKSDIEVDNVGKAVVDDLKNSAIERIEDVLAVYKDFSNEFKESVDDFVRYEEIDKETEELLNTEFSEEEEQEQQTEVIEIFKPDETNVEFNHLEDTDQNVEKFAKEELVNNETLYDLDSAEEILPVKVEEDVMDINPYLNINLDEVTDSNEEKLITENNYLNIDNSYEQDELTNVDISEVNNEVDENVEFKVTNTKLEIDDNEKQYIDSIGNFFPYVSRDLIDNVYEQKEAIALSYTSGMHVKLYHLLTFENLENLNSFIQILDKHNYECKILNDKFQVEVSNEMKVKEGALLTDIYVVANQAGLLSGVYESFSIEELD